MAIKLKNNKGLLWTLLLILFCALVMGGYSQDAGRYQRNRQTAGSDSDGEEAWPSADGGPEENLKSFVRYMYAGSYIMYWELQQKEDSSAIKPSELFFPDTIQESMKSELENFDTEFESWRSAISSLFEQYGIVYRIVDTETGEIYTNSVENLEQYAPEVAEGDVPFFLELTFDQEGSVAISDMWNTDGIELSAGSVRGMTKDRVQKWFIGEDQLTTSLLASPTQVKVYIYSNNELCYYPLDMETAAETGALLAYHEVRDLLFTAYFVLLGLMTILVVVFPVFRRQRRELSGVLGKVSVEWAAAGVLIGMFGIQIGAGFCTLYLRSGYSVWLLMLNFLVYVGIYGIWFWTIQLLLQMKGESSAHAILDRSWIWKNMGRIHRFCKELWKTLLELVRTVDIHDASDRWLAGLLGVQFVILAVCSLFGSFSIVLLLIYSVCLFFLLKKHLARIRESYEGLLQSARCMAEGNLKAVSTGDPGVFASLDQELSKIKDGFSEAVEEELRSRNMKTELITNVSHDLKTPLTAIITYINLLKDPATTEEERKSYVEILDRKSLRLKKLIEDLFEISKAASGTIRLECNWVDIGELLQQAVLEQEDRLMEHGIACRVSVPEERFRLWLDGEKTYRILENLLVNVAKYAMPDTRAWASLEKQGDEVNITIKNTSATELSGDCNELTERFVRGDRARNTEGSGLGLAIVKSFTELQGGKFRIETDGDLFKAIVTFPNVEKEPEQG